MRLGWTEEAMIAGARDVCISPSIIGSFHRKEAALVEVCFLLYLLISLPCQSLEAITFKVLILCSQ